MASGSVMEEARTRGFASLTLAGYALVGAMIVSSSITAERPDAPKT